MPPESKKLWEAPDGSYLEALTRLPVPADQAVEGSRLAWRIGRSMRDDHVATLPLVHWPSPVAGWYLDLRRVAAYSPVLLRWQTLGDYFHRTDRPFEMFRPEPDTYLTPYLAQSVARGDPSPISRRVEFTRLRARLDALVCLEALTATLGESPAADSGDPSLVCSEDALESGRLDEARAGLDRREPLVAAELARVVLSGAPVERTGYLVFNPVGVARRVPVLLPDAAADLRPEGPLRAAQFTEEGVWAIVDVPAFGYAWVPRETALDLPPAPVEILGTKEHTLRNETLEVKIDAATGGIRSLRAPGEPTARLGQQLVIVTRDGTGSKMVSDRYEVDYGGPALVQAVSEGRLVDSNHGRPLARFRQRFRLWSGRPTLDLDIELIDLDPDWLDQARSTDPWSSYLACRWAWPDPDSDLRRTYFLAPEPTTAERPETPDAIDIATRRQRTALLFGGLAHHRRHGPRMLDTLLVAGAETVRTFRLGVVLDQEYPFQAAMDSSAPALVLPVQAGPPATGMSGWFLHVESKAVAVTRVESATPPDTDGSQGLAFHLLETTGRATRCRVRLPRRCVAARQTDFQGDLIVDLTPDGDSLLVDLAPSEIAHVVASLETR
jgi:alpha-mannosidase